MLLVVATAICESWTTPLAIKFKLGVVSTCAVLLFLHIKRRVAVGSFDFSLDVRTTKEKAILPFLNYGGVYCVGDSNALLSGVDALPERTSMLQEVLGMVISRATSDSSGQGGFGRSTCVDW